MTTKPDVQFTVHGKPAPGGSKRHAGGGRIVDACKQTKPWQHTVIAYARQVMDGRPPRREACRVEFIFNKIRPQSHYGKGRNIDKLKPSAPVNWTTRPDALKLSRSVEDALTGFVYFDDSQIVDERLVKRFADHDSCEIRVWFIDEVPVVQQF